MRSMIPRTLAAKAFIEWLLTEAPDDTCVWSAWSQWREARHA